MKLIAIENIKQGQMMPNVWLSLGKHYLNGHYIQINIPLFQLMWGMLPSWKCEKIFGWYVPSIRILYGSHNFIISWWYVFHSDFMGEEIIENTEVWFDKSEWADSK